MKTKNKKSNIGKQILIGSITLALGFFLGWVIFANSGNRQESHNHDIEQSDESTIYTCSMHPQIKQNESGLCPICAMDLVPVTTLQSDDENIDPDEIQMTQSAIELANVQTVIVRQGVPEKSIHLLGKVKPDERNIAELTARFGGRIEKLNVNYTGQHVKKGQKLGTIYSPDLITAQKELLEAIKYKETNPSFYKASHSKLKLWDLTDEQIKTIEETGEPILYFDILSPISGTVMKRHVAVGDYVKEGSALFEVIDLTKVWVMFDAYESDLAWIKKGDDMTFTLQSLPGKTFSSRVSYIDPFIDATTRIAQVRVEVANPDLTFKPEMFVNGILKSTLKDHSDKLLIPRSSILWTGKRAVVYVKVPDRNFPSFIYREITQGPEAGNFYVVSTGLEEGEEIAMNGVFKIDAAAQLAGKPSMMNPEGGIVSTGHNHGDTPMSDEEMAKMKNTKSDNSKGSFEVPVVFKKQLGDVVTGYLEMKDAFVSTDELKVVSDAQKTLDALKNVDMTLLKGEAHNQWMGYQKLLQDNLNGIIRMEGIEMKRSHFSIVSDNLVESIEDFGIHINEVNILYLEFCPMAFDNKGAYWLSKSSEILNPYFGDMMLKCGEVKKEIIIYKQ